MGTLPALPPHATPVSRHRFDLAVQLAALLTGQSTACSGFVPAAALQRAIALRTSGHLTRWQAALGHYPEALRGQIIAQKAAAWSDPHVPEVR